MNLKTLSAACALMTLNSIAAADTLKDIPTKLDPSKAYVLVEYKFVPNPFADFPGSRKMMPPVDGLAFARYDPVLGDVRGMGKALANPVPPKTVVTEAFRNRAIVKTDGARLFLLEVDPDIWVIQGWGSTSFSLGSYTFKAEAGTITDLGVVEGAFDWAEGDHAANGGDIMKMAILGPFAKRPAMAPMRAHFRLRDAADIVLPSAITAYHIQPVKFTAGAKFGNYRGGLVNRIEGVNASVSAAR